MANNSADKQVNNKVTQGNIQVLGMVNDSVTELNSNGDRFQNSQMIYDIQGNRDRMK